MGRPQSKRDRVNTQRDVNSLTLKYDIGRERCGSLLGEAFAAAEARGFTVDEFISDDFDCHSCVHALHCSLAGQGNF